MNRFVLLFIILFSTAVYAQTQTSSQSVERPSDVNLADLNAMSTAEQAKVLEDLLDAKIDAVSETNEELAGRMRRYMFITEKGNKYPEGILRVQIRLSSVGELAKEKGTEPRKISVGKVIDKIFEEKFPELVKKPASNK